MAAEEQVCVVYAGVRGFLDNVMTSEIGKFEQRFLEQLKTRNPEILATIRSEGVLSKETDEKLRSILQEFMPTAGLQMKA